METNTMISQERKKLVLLSKSTPTNTFGERNQKNELKPTAYISYPMTGIAELNYPLECRVFEKLNELGYWIYSPSRLAKFVERSIDKPEYKHYMGFDLWSISRVDVVFLCPGWERSNGCLDEIAFCLRHNIPIIDFSTMRPFDVRLYEAVMDNADGFYNKLLFWFLVIFASFFVFSGMVHWIQQLF